MHYQIVQNIREKMTYVLEKLSSRPVIGGLAISDTGIQYVALDKKAYAVALRFEPGVMKGGILQDKEALKKTLIKLHDLITPKKEQLIKIVAVLPPAAVYTQSFNIPSIDAGHLEEAAKLNLQMLSPIAVDQAYMGYEITNETIDQYELLGGFVDRVIVETMKSVLKETSFFPVAFEFPALALARLIQTILGQAHEPLIVVHVGNDGVNFLIVRKGALYFHYFRTWLSVQGDAKEMSRSLFDDAMTSEMRKIVNFSLSRFKEAIRTVYVVAPGIEAAIQTLLQNNFQMTVTPLVVSAYGLEPVWYSTLGSALRGLGNQNEDTALNLSNESVRKVLFHEQIIGFIRLWRNIFAGALGSMIIILGGAGLLLSRYHTKAVTEAQKFKAQLAGSELSTLERQASEFNALVATIRAAQEGNNERYEIVTWLYTFAKKNQITLGAFDVGRASYPMGLSLIAHATDQQTALRFKNALGAVPFVMNVSLPLSKFIVATDTSVTFTVSFELKQKPLL